MTYSLSSKDLLHQINFTRVTEILLTTLVITGSAFSQTGAPGAGFPGPPGSRYQGAPYQNPKAEAETLPPAVKEVLTQFEEESAVVQQAAEKAQRSLRRRARKELEKLLQLAIEEKRLDEAVLIRNKIRDLQSTTSGVLQNIWNMSAYTQYVGKSFLVQITAEPNSPVYGTDIYTFDSSLPAAAIHTGLLKPGETGILKVTMLPGQQSYTSTTRNGVTSHEYSAYSYSFKLESIDDEAEEDAASEITPELEASLKESRLQNERLEESLKKALETLQTLESQLQKLKR